MVGFRATAQGDAVGVRRVHTPTAPSLFCCLPRRGQLSLIVAKQRCARRTGRAEGPMAIRVSRTCVPSPAGRQWCGNGGSLTSGRPPRLGWALARRLPLVA